MLFNSAEYLLLFLPVTFLIFLLLRDPGRDRARILWLLITSLLFYASWKPEYSLLIVASIVINFQLGKLIARRRRDRRVVLVVGLGLNLASLAYYKYTGFLVDSLNALGLWLLPVPHVVLPLAISFFTFQQIAYLVDVYRGECKDYQFAHYALFVLFFPQLIAGPIVHHREMMPQFDRPPRQRDMPSDIAVGVTIITLGLFKKLILADSMAGIADPLFANAGANGALSMTDAWLATVAFSLQIYFDFSGYSDIAIGSARLFGIVLPENFHSPYKASSIIEIWRRWHMTLSRFLRDYLYITLGGNRRGAVRRYLNVMLTMALGGLWHGAAWTYVIWGTLHGVYLCLNYAWRALQRWPLPGRLAKAYALQPFYILLTFLAWSFALVIFRAPDMATATTIIGAAVLPEGNAAAGLGLPFMHESLFNQVLVLAGVHTGPYLLAGLLVAIGAFICWALPNTQQYMRAHEPVLVAEAFRDATTRWAWRPSLAWACGIAMLLSLCLLSLSSVTEFIYFQF